MPRHSDSHPEWSSLLAAAQEGDRQAYAAFLQAVIPFLRTMARQRASDPNQAEGVVQATLIAIHRLRHTYDPRRPVTPWLAGILAAHSVRARRTNPTWRLSDLLARPSWSPFPAPKLRPT